MPLDSGTISQEHRHTGALLCVVSVATMVGSILSGCGRADSTPTQASPTLPHATLPATEIILVPTRTLAPTTVVSTPTSVEAVPVTVPPSPVCAAIGRTWKRSQDNAVMVCVPAGKFLMGSADSDPEANYREKPQHAVYLDAFWIDKTEVTNAQYDKCAQAGACEASRHASDSRYNGERQPVVGVNWYDAIAYCHWVGAALPTEAQWEKAARGTDARLYPWGNQVATCDYAVMNEGNGDGCGKSATWPVGNKPQGASPYGALDMAGNVAEWVADPLDSSYYAESPSSNPPGPAAGLSRVHRGGSAMYDARFLRAAHRGWSPLNAWNWTLGFRCALGAAP